MFDPQVGREVAQAAAHAVGVTAARQVGLDARARLCAQRSALAPHRGVGGVRLGVDLFGGPDFQIDRQRARRTVHPGAAADFMAVGACVLRQRLRVIQPQHHLRWGVVGPGLLAQEAHRRFMAVQSDAQLHFAHQGQRPVLMVTHTARLFANLRHGAGRRLEFLLGDQLVCRLPGNAGGKPGPACRRLRTGRLRTHTPRQRAQDRQAAQASNHPQPHHRHSFKLSPNALGRHCHGAPPNVRLRRCDTSTLEERGEAA